MLYISGLYLKYIDIFCGDINLSNLLSEPESLGKALHSAVSYIPVYRNECDLVL